ncbi:hypothetical protein [Microlunatus soli]|uniref:Uncharacterized protein n=1 Tax=Microlunatus soli TaxID=630515 RepID=A0A1H1N9U1_9ACTN|nr:hypothetical protein [Microlunatus soli]SDR95763.1 hypothetical protein SAMN04489812_0442 [Microlunatus soli]
MAERNTLVRSLHDLGLAAWFGGSLMGATGLNGAASDADDPTERLRLSTSGWARWLPWQIAAIGAHTIGGVGLLITSRTRLKRQSGALPLTITKLAVTGLAAGSTAWSGYLGAQVKAHQDQGAEGPTEADATADAELQAAQRRLRALQWITPALTGTAIALAAAHGEQQRGPAGLMEYAAQGLRSRAHRTVAKVG